MTSIVECGVCAVVCIVIGHIPHFPQVPNESEPYHMFLRGCCRISQVPIPLFFSYVETYGQVPIQKILVRQVFLVHAYVGYLFLLVQIISKQFGRSMSMQNSTWSKTNKILQGTFYRSIRGLQRPTATCCTAAAYVEQVPIIGTLFRTERLLSFNGNPQVPNRNLRKMRDILFISQNSLKPKP